jgi:hypothetical protein
VDISDTFGPQDEDSFLISESHPDVSVIRSLSIAQPVNTIYSRFKRRQAPTSILNTTPHHVASFHHRNPLFWGQNIAYVPRIPLEEGNKSFSKVGRHFVLLFGREDENKRMF